MRSVLTYSEMFNEALTNAWDGWPLIFFAVQKSSWNIFAYLLEAGTPVDIVSPPGLSLLAFVILCRDNLQALDMVKLLLQKGVDPRTVPVEVFAKTGGPCWGAVREKASKTQSDLPTWWMAAPEVWLQNMKGRLTPAIR